MTFELNKQIADDLMKVEGEMKGVVFKTDEKFILKNGGEKKLKEIEEEIKTLGYSLRYAEVNSLQFYPIGLRVLSLLAIANAFGMDEKRIREMGSLAPKTSLVIKFFMQHFLSIESTFNKASEIWNKHYMIGRLVPVESNKKERFVRIRLENFNVHPILCHYLAGYFSKICEIAAKNPAEAKEEKCSFRGDSCHEYKIKW